MSVFRINKIKDYTIMSNYHLKDTKISLKAKGLLSQMLSLPEEWDYSIQGLVAINKESEVAIKGALDELKEYRYLIVSKMMPNETKSGRIEYVYNIYEKPKQEGGFLGVEFLGVENQVQYNTNNKILNNKENNNINIITKERFKKPTLEEVQEYCKERNNGIDAQRFIDFYESKNWMIGKNKMKDWKACIRTWENRNTSQDKKIPIWFDKNQELDIMSKQEQNEIENILKEIGE